MGQTLEIRRHRGNLSGGFPSISTAGCGGRTGSAEVSSARVRKGAELGGERDSVPCVRVACGWSGGPLGSGCRNNRQDRDLGRKVGSGGHAGSGPGCAVWALGPSDGDVVRAERREGLEAERAHGPGRAGSFPFQVPCCWKQGAGCGSRRPGEGEAPAPGQGRGGRGLIVHFPEEEPGGRADPTRTLAAAVVFSLPERSGRWEPSVTQFQLRCH